jgi:sugar phosphate isomerase/epimerase
MRVGISMWSFHRTAKRGELSVANFIRVANDLGVKDIELLNVFWRETDDEIRAASDLMREFGLSVSAYDVGNDFAQADRSDFRRSLSEVERGVEVAKAIGAPYVRVFGGEPKDGISRARAYELMIEGLSAGADYAGDRGVKLALENHGELYGTGDQLLGIMKRVNSPNLGLNFDVGNFVPAGDDANSALDKVFRYVLHVHVKDFRRAKPDDEETFLGVDSVRYALAGPGEGKTDMAKFVRRLGAFGYAGVLSLENESPGDELGNAKKYLATLRRMMG